MIGPMRHAILILAALGLAACASNGLQLSAAQCATDWRSVGVADGVDGAPETKINQYRSACSGSAPLAASDIAAWKAGWAEGADVALEIEESEVGQADASETHTHETHTHGDDGYGHRVRPVVSPSIFVGVGSGGVRGGVGVGLGVGLFRLGLGVGF